MYKLSQGRFVSGNGILVECLDRHYILYMKNNTGKPEFTLVLNTADSLQTPGGLLIIFPEDLRYCYPNDKIEITKERREEIKNEIIEAYKVLEPKVTVAFVH